MSFLMSMYRDQIIQELKEELSLENIMQVPVLKKIVLNSGVNSQRDDSKIIEQIVSDLTLIAGQKPVITKAKKSIAGFKLREGMQVGVKVTLRNRIMYDFLGRLVHVALPRVRDFSGLSLKSFDKGANYSFGIREHIVFPEINFDRVLKIYGFDITLVMKSNSVEHSLALLRKFNFPIRKSNK